MNPINGPQLDLLAILIASLIIMVTMANLVRADDCPASYTERECRLQMQVETLKKANSLLAAKVRRSTEEIIILRQKNEIEKKLRSTEPVVYKPYNNKNSLNILGGSSGEGLDMGLMFQRDFGRMDRWRTSIGLTLDGAAYLGMGLNF